MCFSFGEASLACCISVKLMQGGREHALRWVCLAFLSSNGLAMSLNARLPTSCKKPLVYSKHRQVTDLDVTDLGFSGPRIPFCTTGALWGRVTPFFDHFAKQLSSVLRRTELCHEVRNPWPQKPQIIRNENHHLALLEY